MQVVCQLYIYIYTVTVYLACACRSRISADATEIQNDCPDKVLKGVQKILLCCTLCHLKEHNLYVVCNFKTLSTFVVVQFIVKCLQTLTSFFYITVISPN